METLGISQKTMAILKKYHFRLQKKYGQNFLIDASVLDRIMEASQIGKEDCVLEIGPGIGTMTGYLAGKAGKLIAVEIDKALIPILEETLSDYHNIIMIQGDILKTDICKLAQDYNNGSPLKVVANLPYYITTPIIMALLEGNAPIESITIMIQKEVAERIQAEPGTKEYGALSLAARYYAETKIITEVSPNSFIPKPGVGSVVMHFKKYEKPPVEVQNENFMFSLIRASFNQRRKTLVNGLLGASNLHLSKEKILEALEKMALPAAVRGEMLSVEQFARLSDYLTS